MPQTNSDNAAPEKTPEAAPVPAAELAAKAAILDRLVERAKELVPVLRERSARTEELRRLPDETMHDLFEAGFFKSFRPVRFGGYELDFGPTQVKIYSELGRGDGSSTWVTAIITSKPLMIGMFPAQAQEEVYGENQDAIVCDSLSPEGSAEFEPVAGGYRVSGRWKFASGVDFANWVLVGAVFKGATRLEGYYCLLPKRDFKVIDTWFVGGLRGTGSNDVEINRALVPSHRVVPIQQLAEGRGPGAEVNSCHIYRLPIIGVFPINLCTPAIGIARGVIEQYCERLQTQVATPIRARAAEVEANQLHVAEAAALVDCATTLMMRDGEEMNRIARSRIPFTSEQMGRYRRDISFSAELSIRAVDIIHRISGAHGLFEENPLQRAFRDVHAIGVHAGIRWDVNALPYGRAVLGLDK